MLINNATTSIISVSVALFQIAKLMWIIFTNFISASMSNIPALIRKKRDGEELSAKEIDEFVAQVVKGTAQDSQIGATILTIF